MLTAESQPLQFEKLEPAAGLAVRTTELPLTKDAEQVVPHEMPAGVLVTVPARVPALTTARVYDWLIVKGRALELAAPAVATVTCAVPAVLTSLADMEACNRVLLTNVVVRLAPFHCTVEVEPKLLPVALNTKLAEPAVILLGLSELSVTAVAVTVNGIA